MSKNFLLASTLLLAACASKPATDSDKSLQLANDLSKRGDYASAAALYERAAQQPGAGIELWLKLGQTKLDARDAQGAERAFQQALGFDARNADALLGLGTAQLQLGKTPRAVTALGQAADISGLPVAYTRLGVAQILNGQAAAAQSTFAKSLNLKPDDLDNRCNLALAYALGGQSQQALDTIAPVAQSPRALPRHQRNELLVMVLAGYEQRAAGLPLDDIPAAERERLVSEAKRIKGISDPVVQARELGLVDPR
ncbi:tetratricopeptide repeat protein [Pseudomonas sp. HN11]|uniref:tetratricopeptide repeat protein n=1 Tax=Pseudomonas sp. HN11 TaxID=1344094 RepID=UPI001F37A1DA|nr:tetratricopeptide repeat protein [Pseudomonas sp. HN11]UII69397.1 tetratricopeptide repeat protein [Pseudomonas sp. HN11]